MTENEKSGVFGKPEEKDIDRLTSMHHKILDTTFAEVVTEKEMIAFLRARDALQKQIPKKPIDIFGTFYECPECECDILRVDGYCHNCGQKLDWRYQDE